MEHLQQQLLLSLSLEALEKVILAIVKLAMALRRTIQALFDLRRYSNLHP